MADDRRRHVEPVVPLTALRVRPRIWTRCWAARSPAARSAVRERRSPRRLPAITSSRTCAAAGSTAARRPGSCRRSRRTFRRPSICSPLQTVRCSIWRAARAAPPDSSGRIIGPTGALVGIDPTAATITQPITVTGYAIDLSSATGTGVDAIQVWAYPNPGSSQPAVFVAAATYGLDAVRRLARATALASRRAATRSRCGDWHQPHISWSCSHGARCQAPTRRRRGRLRCAPNPLMALDVPAPGAAIRQPFVLGGWAIDRAGIGTGVDGVDVQAIPTGGGAPVALGSAIVRRRAE